MPHLLNNIYSDVKVNKNTIQRSKKNLTNWLINVSADFLVDPNEIWKSDRNAKTDQSYEAFYRWPLEREQTEQTDKIDI